MAFVIPEPPRATIPVEGSHQLFPVRRIFCVGRNYAEHTREMGGDPHREPPFFFTKPADALVPMGGKLSFPIATKDLHYEVELAVALKGGGRQLSADAAQALIFGYAVALDMTRRDLRAEAERLARALGRGRWLGALTNPVRSARCARLHPHRPLCAANSSFRSTARCASAATFRT